MRTEALCYLLSKETANSNMDFPDNGVTYQAAKNDFNFESYDTSSDMHLSRVNETFVGKSRCLPLISGIEMTDTDPRKGHWAGDVKLLLQTREYRPTTNLIVSSGAYRGPDSTDKIRFYEPAWKDPSGHIFASLSPSLLYDSDPSLQNAYYSTFKRWTTWHVKKSLAEPLYGRDFDFHYSGRADSLSTSDWPIRCVRNGAVSPNRPHYFSQFPDDALCVNVPDYVDIYPQVECTFVDTDPSIGLVGGDIVITPGVLHDQIEVGHRETVFDIYISNRKLTKTTSFAEVVDAGKHVATIAGDPQAHTASTYSLSLRTPLPVVSGGTPSYIHVITRRGGPNAVAEAQLIDRYAPPGAPDFLPFGLEFEDDNSGWDAIKGNVYFSPAKSELPFDEYCIYAGTSSQPRGTLLRCVPKGYGGSNAAGPKNPRIKIHISVKAVDGVEVVAATTRCVPILIGNVYASSICDGESAAEISTFVTIRQGRALQLSGEVVPLFPPKKLTFTDEHVSKWYISGTAYLEPADYEDDVIYYTLYRSEFPDTPRTEAKYVDFQYRGRIIVEFEVKTTWILTDSKYLLAFAYNVGGYHPTPAIAEIVNLVDEVPQSTLTLTSFYDTDGHRGIIAGEASISCQAPCDEATHVLAYVGFADESVTNFSELKDVDTTGLNVFFNVTKPAGAIFSIPGTSTISSTSDDPSLVLVMLNEAGGTVWRFPISDREVPRGPLGVSFADNDPGPDRVSGNIILNPPTDDENVEGYMAIQAASINELTPGGTVPSSSFLEKRWHTTAVKPTDPGVITIAVNSVIPSLHGDRLFIFSVSTAGISFEYQEVVLVDLTVPSVSPLYIHFVDNHIASKRVEGLLSVGPLEVYDDSNPVESYEVYAGLNSTMLISISVDGQNEVSAAIGPLDFQGKLSFRIHTRSLTGLSSYYSAHQVTDKILKPPYGLSYDSSELKISRNFDETDVNAYKVYLAYSSEATIVPIRTVNVELSERNNHSGVTGTIDHAELPFPILSVSGVVFDESRSGHVMVSAWNEAEQVESKFSVLPFGWAKTSHLTFIDSDTRPGLFGGILLIGVEHGVPVPKVFRVYLANTITTTPTRLLGIIDATKGVCLNYGR
eukprot:GHVT01069477.1.p1 GENE.GHVT01069477.1~~GHVT01069477.1.p1  ORF type:complete len:1108 (-),score=27.75 GHVT01069477.1:65-3388(-)